MRTTRCGPVPATGLPRGDPGNRECKDPDGLCQHHDYATLSWQDASKLVADGDAAFNIMGDWADGYFYGDVAGETWDSLRLRNMPGCPFPEHGVSTEFLSDSFVLPVGAKNRDAAIKWLGTYLRFQGRSGCLQPCKGFHRRPQGF